MLGWLVGWLDDGVFIIEWDLTGELHDGSVMNDIKICKAHSCSQ